MSIFDETHDVVVAGGGPAGFAAALAAGRGGAGTVLIERYGYLGGMASTGLPFLTYRDREGQQRVFGIASEFAERARSEGFTEDTPSGSSWLVIDPEGVKLLFQEMLLEAGVRLLLHSWVQGAFVKEDRIEGLLVLSKGGSRAVRGKAFVDCTGDADVAALCGVPFQVGREDGKTMGMSLIFALAGIDTEKFQSAVKSRWPSLVQETGLRIPEEIKEKTFLDEARFMPYMINPKRPGEIIFNWVQLILDRSPLDPEDLTAAEVEARRLIRVLVSRVIRPHIPGCGQAYVSRTACQMGVRESRRIRGQYTLTGDDFRSQGDFHDTIALCTYPFDLHASSRSDEKNVFIDREFRGAVRIPYRVMVPETGPSNLLVSGRSVSADRLALSAIRVMVPCMSMGEAAGYAAAQAAEKGISMRDVDVCELRSMLDLRT